MAVKLLSSSGGSVTIDVPVTASNFALTVPAANGTVITTGSTGQVIPKAALPTGSVLQTLSFSLSSLQSTSSTSYASSFLQQAITPSSVSSKILITINAGIYVSTAAPCKVTLYRDGTNILATNGFYQGTIVNQEVPCSLTFLDSPATTSSINYNMRYLILNGGTVYLSINDTTSNITVQEIAG
jgi:hypothetical protein